MHFTDGNIRAEADEVGETSVDRFRQGDISHFLQLADQEGWICDRWEFAFLFATFPAGCFVVRCDSGPVAFVTAVAYERSGWVGNLLVRRDLRGRGLGRRLMKEALGALADAGIETVWLTASEDGRPLYETLGFRVMDTIVRWRADRWSGRLPEGDKYDALVAELDEEGWGDRRGTLLRGVSRRGTLRVGDGGFLVLQPTGAGLQVGPWGGRGAAGRLLDELLLSIGPGERSVFLDVPRSNAEAVRLLQQNGFRESGATTLMCCGKPPRYRGEAIFALASMGSMG